LRRRGGGDSVLPGGGGHDHDGRAAGPARSAVLRLQFYGFSLEEHVPADHLLRAIDRFVELSDIRRQLEPFYSAIGRPSVDPELMIRMLLIGYCSIRSERRLCEEVHLNLAYRWFCRLGAYSNDRGQQFQAIVGTNSTASWAGFMPIGLWIRKAGWRQAFRLSRCVWR
jgi:hypothetical protein